MVPSTTRMFDGKTYRWQKYHRLKRNAEKTAKMFRDQGKMVRVVPMENPKGYSIYTRG